MNDNRPLIIQSDRTVLLEVGSPAYAEVRDAIAPFAELEKSPEHIHTYRISPLSVWNAASTGIGTAEILATLERYAKYPVPKNVVREIEQWIARYGKIRLETRDGRMELVSGDTAVLAEACSSTLLKPYLRGELTDGRVAVDPVYRGHVKQALLKIGYPVEDLAGYVIGGPLDVRLREATREGRPLSLRPYQIASIDAFWQNGTVRGGSGVVVLPCGAGKTIVGIGTMDRCRTKTLVLTTHTIAVRQWRDEILDKTNLTEDDVAEYTGESKDVRPVTIATYQILTYRRSKTEPFIHFDLFKRNDWGLIIYDEVHLLPAPVFRITAEIQATRRLGLTATLVREDGQEQDVFTLIGPKRFDVPWKVLESQGWIATATCIEVRVALPDELKMEYALADNRTKFRLSSENTSKIGVVQKLAARHASDQVLVIGQYLDQLERLAVILRAPLITGRTPNKEREKLYDAFREGTLKLLMVSKVGNFAVDLPDANVLVQVSGTYGSRQEEAQRLGRILRPKPNAQTAYFYSLVTRDTRDQDFSSNRQLFLTEQGYSYRILDEHELPS
ncbi:MAG: helicase-associated domain-containing protein [Planctomycetes bacterium]|nr:helicase-associated domain-containing protein [Planctomycetota bacterium]